MEAQLAFFFVCRACWALRFALTFVLCACCCSCCRSVAVPVMKSSWARLSLSLRGRCCLLDICVGCDCRWYRKMTGAGVGAGTFCAFTAFLLSLTRACDSSQAFPLAAIRSWSRRASSDLCLPLVAGGLPTICYCPCP